MTGHRLVAVLAVARIVGASSHSRTTIDDRDTTSSATRRGRVIAAARDVRPDAPRPPPSRHRDAPHDDDHPPHDPAARFTLTQVTTITGTISPKSVDRDRHRARLRAEHDVPRTR